MYRIFDRVVDSAVALPELEPVDSTRADFRFEVRAGRYDARQRWEALHEWTLPDGAVSIRCSRSGDDYLLGFPGMADFMVSDRGRTITCFTEPAVGMATVRHLLVDQVLPRLMGHEGRLALHASSVLAPGGDCIAFLGPAGHGKSTLAAGLHERGLQVLSDDCLVVETRDGTAWAIPAYRGLRLWPDGRLGLHPEQAGFPEIEGYGSKRRFGPGEDGRLSTAPVPYRLDSLFLLEEPESRDAAVPGSISAASGGRASMVFLLSCLFTMDPTDLKRAGENFERCGDLLESGVRTWRLGYWREPAVLQSACEAIQSWIKDQGR